MSHLPDNIEDWPSDPYQVLNAEESMDKKTLKRLYTRLIRVYNPNHSPEHFRKVREAYDEILDNIKAAEYFSSLDIQVDEKQENTDSVPKARQDWYDQSIDLWQEAIAGNVEGVLHKFKEAHEKDPDPDTTLKLYWLMKLNKSSTAELIYCLQKSIELSSDSRVLQAFFRELENEEEWVVNPEYLDFAVKASSNDLSIFRQFIVKRWEVFYKNKEFINIQNDIEQVRSQFALASEDEWALLLLFVHKFISFAPGYEIVTMLKKYHAELEAIPVSAGGDFDAAMDYYEFLRTVRKAVRKADVGELPQEWREIISDFWVGNEKLYSDKLRKVMVRWCEEPMKALSSLESVPYQMRAIIFTQVKRIVYSFSLTQGPYIFIQDDSTIAKKCIAFLKGREGLRYPIERNNIMKFCLNEGVAPDTLHDYIVENQLVQYRWVTEVVEDLHQAVFMCYKSLMSYLSSEELEHLSQSHAG